MYSNSKILLFLIIVLTASFLYGCAEEVEKSTWDPSVLVWPVPPDRPRIKYFDSFKNESDVGQTQKKGVEAIFSDEAPEVQLLKPYGVVVDDQGRVYVSDPARIFVFDKQNKKLFFIGDSGQYKVQRPLGMAIDNKNGILYVADSKVDRVLAFKLNGDFVRYIGKEGVLKDPGGVAVDTARNRIYVSSTKDHVILVFDLNGEFVKNMGKRGGEEGEFNFPTQITLDKEGNLYVVDTGNFRVQMFDPEGKFIRRFGEIGVKAGQFARPKGVSVSPEGYVFVADSTHDGINVYNSRDGQHLLSWGAKGVEKGLFQVISTIFVNDKGLIYVVNQWTARVDVFQFISYPEDQSLQN